MVLTATIQQTSKMTAYLKQKLLRSYTDGLNAILPGCLVLILVDFKLYNTKWKSHNNLIQFSPTCWVASNRVNIGWHAATLPSLLL